jgi:D-alanyl-lipoteichoic acid acyltransferase DltB (MBOAT superfamily)
MPYKQTAVISQSEQFSATLLRISCVWELSLLNVEDTNRTMRVQKSLFIIMNSVVYSLHDLQ